MAFPTKALFALVVSFMVLHANAQDSDPSDIPPGLIVNVDGSVSVVVNGRIIFTSAAGVASSLSAALSPAIDEINDLSNAPYGLPAFGTPPPPAPFTWSFTPQQTPAAPTPKNEEVQQLLQGILGNKNRRMKL